MQLQKKQKKEMEKILIIFLIILYWDYLSGFFGLKEYQIDLDLCFVPILIGVFGKHISILTIFLRNALL